MFLSGRSERGTVNLGCDLRDLRGGWGGLGKIATAENAEVRGRKIENQRSQIECLTPILGDL